MKYLRTFYMALALIFGTLTISDGWAQVIKAATTKKDSTNQKKSTLKAYKDIITADAVTKVGVLTVHNVGDKYYFEVPDSILGREFLITNWVLKAPAGTPKYSGEQINQNTFYFEKGRGDVLYVRYAEHINKSDSTQMIYKAVRNSGVAPIIMTFDIKAYGPHKNAVIDVTDLFQKDNILSSVGSLKKDLGLTALQADKTFLQSIHTYPLNIEVTSTRTYSAAAKPISVRPGKPGKILEAAKEAGAITVEIRNSIMLLPQVPMRQRLFDPRVGYFAGGYNDFSDTEQRIKSNVFIVRYRLEPKEEDIEKYKRGELVEPKKQIVYYTDPATPKQWVPYIIAGINDWNKAFEQAGFKNAIVGKPWPENDTTMSTEDARYAIVRYLPSDNANAYGPNIHDPRSGEILQSYVGWYHNIMKLLHDWYMVQAAAVDPEARKMVFSDSLMGELIRFASSHEVGHTLGLRHNMGSSSTTPVALLRNKKWVEANGHTPSIMDYARFNYVAQPEDSISRAGIFPRIGSYDKWAIEWGYKYTGENDSDKDRKVAAKWILDSLNANPRLWFGGEGRNNDPRCQTEDLGDNNMEANAYGVKNLKWVMTQLPEWAAKEDDFNKSLYEGYLAVTSQFARYMLQVANNVGGIYQTIKSVDQPGPVYQPSPKAKQQEAIAFLNKQVFATQDWLINRPLLNRISKSTNGVGFQNVQKVILGRLFSDQVLFGLLECSSRYGTDTTYTINEMLQDVKNGVWGELKTGQPIEMFRRDLQKEYVMQLLREIREAEVPTRGLFATMVGLDDKFPIMETSDVSSVLGQHLEGLRADCLKAIAGTSDKMTREHLQYIALIIKNGLDNRFDPAKKSVLGE